MSPEMPRRSWKPWVAPLLVGLGVFVGSSIPAHALPAPGLFPAQDKVVHLCEYGLLGFLVARALAAGAPARALGWTWATAVGVAVVYGLTDEFHQAFVPGRSVEGLDVVADLVGGALGATTFAIIVDRRSRRLRSDRKP
jgi:VanZ family protein